MPETCFNSGFLAFFNPLYCNHPVLILAVRVLGVAVPLLNSVNIK